MRPLDIRFALNCCQSTLRSGLCAADNDVFISPHLSNSISTSFSHLNPLTAARKTEREYHMRRLRVARAFWSNCLFLWQSGWSGTEGSDCRLSLNLRAVLKSRQTHPPRHQGLGASNGPSNAELDYEASAREVIQKSWCTHNPNMNISPSNHRFMFNISRR